MINNFNYSFIALFNEADIVVKSIMIALIVASIFSWSIILEKIIRIKLVKRRCERFEMDFAIKNIEELFKNAKSNNNNIHSRLFLSAMREWKKNDIKAIIMDKTGSRKLSLKERLNGVMSVSINRSIQKLEIGLNMLAIIGSSAPFVGLFGTVWGIMNSFQSIALMKNTSLAVVAPGIAEALLATGIGLFVAIPAVFFYNIFIARINRLYEMGGNFSVELSNIFSRELDK
jgi:biopolymer transport protein TolQ|tara:strand:- start:5778 stop:6467 length:690 start_codon:yes stop_codon:yes gene_type:complete